MVWCLISKLPTDKLVEFKILSIHRSKGDAEREMYSRNENCLVLDIGRERYLIAIYDNRLVFSRFECWKQWINPGWTCLLLKKGEENYLRYMTSDVTTSGHEYAHSLNFLPIE